MEKAEMREKDRLKEEARKVNQSVRMNVSMMDVAL